LLTEDFPLHEPGKAALLAGHEAARQMRASPTPKPPVNVQILELIEEGDRVDVRRQTSATDADGNADERSIVAIYRFANGRIADGWGITGPALWFRGGALTQMFEFSH
jgi:predicted SnoaL-like aldol condensation-catalyzing enzyme